MAVRKPKGELFQQLSDSGFSMIPIKGKSRSKMAGPNGVLENGIMTRLNLTGNNAGITCGPASGVLALDPDHLQKFEKYCRDNNWILPRTRKHKTGSGNFHLLYKYPVNGREYGNKSIKDPEGEINPKTKKVITVFDTRGIGGKL